MFNGTDFGSIVLNKICAQEGWSQFANLWASENKRIEAFYVAVGGGQQIAEQYHCKHPEEFKDLNTIIIPKIH